MVQRTSLPDWPRLMSEPLAASYLSLSATTLRERGPKPVRLGSRVLYDRKDLDRWVDALGHGGEVALTSEEVERRFFEKRAQSERQPAPQRMAYSTRTLAERWRCSEQLIRNMIRREELKAFRYGNLIRITAEAVAEVESRR